MTIVELVDLHKGLNVITNRIHTVKNYFIVDHWRMTFFLSAVLIIDHDDRNAFIDQKINEWPAMIACGMHLL